MMNDNEFYAALDDLIAVLSEDPQIQARLDYLRNTGVSTESRYKFLKNMLEGFIFDRISKFSIDNVKLVEAMDQGARAVILSMSALMQGFTKWKQFRKCLTVTLPGTNTKVDMNVLSIAALPGPTPSIFVDLVPARIQGGVPADLTVSIAVKISRLASPANMIIDALDNSNSLAQIISSLTWVISINAEWSGRQECIYFDKQHIADISNAIINNI